MLSYTVSSDGIGSAATAAASDYRISCANCALFHRLERGATKERAIVWLRWFSDRAVGHCALCFEDLPFWGMWQAGHDIAHARAGTNFACNKRPVCGDCNVRMRTSTFKEYLQRNGGDEQLLERYREQRCVLSEREARNMWQEARSGVTPANL